MPKRARSESLTGGTGDVNPQWFLLNTQTITGAYADIATPMPIQRLPTGNKSQVMEVLKVEWSFSNANLINPLGTASTSARGYISTTSFGTAEPTNAQLGKVVSRRRIDVPAVATVANTFAVLESVWVEDLTDEAGHGYLVATDNIYLGQVQTTASTNPLTSGFQARILYRMKNVGIQEYVGIVQSQN